MPSGAKEELWSQVIICVTLFLRAAPFTFHITSFYQSFYGTALSPHIQTVYISFGPATE